VTTVDKPIVVYSTKPNLRAAWSGGSYIDVLYGSQAIDVINVWDSATDEPTIPRDNRKAAHDAVAGKLREWIKESYADYLENVIRYL
jgi:hypothetical protein